MLFFSTSLANAKVLVNCTLLLVVLFLLLYLLLVILFINIHNLSIYSSNFVLDYWDLLSSLSCWCISSLCIRVLELLTNIGLYICFIICCSCLAIYSITLVGLMDFHLHNLGYPIYIFETSLIKSKMFCITFHYFGDIAIVSLKVSLSWKRGDRAPNLGERFTM